MASLKVLLLALIISSVAVLFVSANFYENYENAFSEDADEENALNYGENSNGVGYEEFRFEEDDMTTLATSGISLSATIKNYSGKTLTLKSSAATSGTISASSSFTSSGSFSAKATSSSGSAVGSVVYYIGGSTDTITLKYSLVFGGTKSYSVRYHNTL